MFRKSVLAALVIVLASCAVRQERDPAIVYHEFHYDWFYKGKYGYRVIAAYRLAEASGLPEESQKIIRDLVYGGLSFEEFAEYSMKQSDQKAFFAALPALTALKTISTLMGNDLGNDNEDVESLENDSENREDYTDMGVYQFSDRDDSGDDPQHDRLHAERWPEGAEDPLYEVQTVFDSYDIIAVHGDFVVMANEFSSIASDAVHGQSSVAYATVDLLNAKILQWDDVFVPGAFEKLKNRVSRMLGDIPFEWYKAESLPLPDQFYFAKDGLRIFWEPYHIAAGGAGVVSVVVPFSAVRGYLTADGRRLRKSLSGAWEKEEGKE